MHSLGLWVNSLGSLFGPVESLFSCLALWSGALGSLEPSTSLECPPNHLRRMSDIGLDRVPHTLWLCPVSALVPRSQS